MTKIYKLVLDEQRYNKLVESGWIPCPPVLFKEFDVNYDSDAARTVVDLFNDQIWQQTFLSNKDLKSYLKKRGIRFRKGKVVENDKFKELATKWCITIDGNEEGWIGVSSVEEYYPVTFYKKDLIDEYCKEQINELRELGFLEETEVDDQ